MIEFKNIENIYFILIIIFWLIALFIFSFKKLKMKQYAFANSNIFNRISNRKPTKKPYFKAFLIIFAVLFIGFTILRPLGESYEEEVNGSGLDLVVALDISKSMNAFDIEGNSRLYVAKTLLANMVDGLKNDRVGLVVFAGETMVQSPLTYDKSAFITSLNRVNPNLLSEQGTNLKRAIQTSIDRFSITASQSKVIVLVSDGEDPEVKDLNSVISEANKKDIKIFTVGIGSLNGGRIPESRDVFGDMIYKRNKNGTLVISKLSEAPLKEIAKGTNASYFRASSVKTANQVIKGLNGIKRVAVSGGKVTVRKELYFIPLVIAFFLLLIEWGISDREISFLKQ